MIEESLFVATENADRFDEFEVWPFCKRCIRDIYSRLTAPRRSGSAQCLGQIMRLTNFSDRARRLLMYVAAREDRLIAIEEASVDA
jgi:hypothetical protein